jgi:hypothetical protein
MSSGGCVNMSSGGCVNMSSGGCVNMSSGGCVNMSSGGCVNISSGGCVNMSSGGCVNMSSGSCVSMSSGGCVNMSSGGCVNMSSGGCVNSPNCFCYFCGQRMIEKHQRNITGFIINGYYTYFGVKLGDQGKSWAAHEVCYVCVEDVREWSKGKRKHSDLLYQWYGGSHKITLNIDIFAVVMLRVTTVKIRRLPCNSNFLQIYALFLMAQRYLSQYKY